MQGLASDLKQFFLVKNNLLTSVHNDANARDDANDYNRVTGIALLKAFSFAKKNTTNTTNPAKKFTNTGCKYSTNQGLKSLLQIGCPIIITRKTKTSQSKAGT